MPASAAITPDPSPGAFTQQNLASSSNCWRTHFPAIKNLLFYGFFKSGESWKFWDKHDDYLNFFSENQKICELPATTMFPGAPLRHSVTPSQVPPMVSHGAS